jgi:K+-sensing histidine kinase KdpD
MRLHSNSGESDHRFHLDVARLAAVRNAAIGVGLCTAAAVAITLVLRHAESAGNLPFAFLLVVAAVAHRYGTTSAFIGLATGGCIFATFLFRPVGSLSIANAAARTDIVMMLLFGMAVAYFYGPGDDDSHFEQK